MRVLFVILGSAALAGCADELGITPERDAGASTEIEATNIYPAAVTDMRRLAVAAPLDDRMPCELGHQP